jgi:predicted metalloprotease
MRYLCVCGELLSNTVYPSPVCGDLKWQTEFDNASQNSSQALKDFFNAVESGTKDAWLTEFFNQSTVYSRLDMATIVADIVSKCGSKEGHSVFRCPECERLYVQKQYCTDDYDCFEKRQGYTR